jgi:hypothetical protein
VAPGFETGPLPLTSSWTQYEIPVTGLDYAHFDPDMSSSEPSGLTAFSAAAVNATTIYVDDVRWVRDSEPPPCANPGCE